MPTLLYSLVFRFLLHGRQVDSIEERGQIGNERPGQMDETLAQSTIQRTQLRDEKDDVVEVDGYLVAIRRTAR